jgi:uncharacterized protein YciW
MTRYSWHSASLLYSAFRSAASDLYAAIDSTQVTVLRGSYSRGLHPGPRSRISRSIPYPTDAATAPARLAALLSWASRCSVGGALRTCASPGSTSE